MYSYYLNASATGDAGTHKVHSDSCGCLKWTGVLIPLGKFESSDIALAKARLIFNNATPCFYCCGHKH